MRSTATCILVPAILVSACATTPDVTAGYYLPKTSVDLQVIRSVGCNDAGEIRTATTVTAPVIHYSRDSAAGMQQVRFKALSRGFNNSNLGLTYYDDGRLKGVNAASAGKGDEIVKTAFGIASSMVPGLRIKSRAAPTPSEMACAMIKKYGKDGVITLTYTATEEFGSPDARVSEIGLRPGSAEHEQIIDRPLSRLCLVLERAITDRPLTRTSETERTAAILLELRQPATVPASVVERSSRDPATRASCSQIEAGKTLWSGSFTVPQQGERYVLPIPRPAFFGAQSFELGLAESGAVTTLKYGKDSGMPGALAAANAAALALKPLSVAEQANELKAEADLIAQQQRLLRCEMKPADCK